MKGLLDLSDPAAKLRLIRAVEPLEGVHQVSITRWAPTRSNAQNRLWWGVIVPAVAEALGEAWGEGVTDEQAHIFLKQKFLKRPVVNRETGELLGEVVGSTATLDRREFSELVENVRKWCAEWLNVGIRIR